MIEYSQFTDDASYVETLQEALTANYGPANDFIMSYRKSQTVRESFRPCEDSELTKDTGQR
jgi:hypothetical protein